MNVAGQPRAAVCTAALLLATVAPLAVADDGSATVGVDKPRERCFATATSPVVLATMPVALPDVVWDRKPVFFAQIRFHVDEAGNPADVSTSVDDVADDARDALEQTVNDAFTRFRFCRPGAFSPGRTWKAKLMFSPLRPGNGGDGLSVYIQQFVPGYVGFEKFGAHGGRAVVRGTYGVDGRPRAVEVVSSSGDRLLDDKSLDSMASAQLIFREGSVPAAPLRITRPFTYRQ